MVGVALFIAFPFVVLAVALFYQVTYHEDRIASELCRRLDLTRKGSTLTGKRLKLNFQWTSLGNSKTLHVHYSLNLPEQSLSLMPEGAQSGQEASKGSREMEVGDVDFDDYFWVQSCREDYLTPERRALLIDLFRQTRVKEIKRGQVVGSVRCEQSPWGVAAVCKVLQRLQRLPYELAHPPEIRHGRPEGWVGRERRRAVAGICWVIGLSLCVPAYVLGVPFTALPATYLAGLTMCSGLTGISLLLLGFLILQGSRQALRVGRVAQAIATFTVLLTAPLWLQAATFIGTLIAGGLALFTISKMNEAYLAITRLRLS